jgi:hypothetical protein
MLAADEDAERRRREINMFAVLLPLPSPYCPGAGVVDNNSTLMGTSFDPKTLSRQTQTTVTT